jgi:hypothetical protein
VYQARPVPERDRHQAHPPRSSHHLRLGKPVSSAAAAERVGGPRNSRSGWRNALDDLLAATRTTEIQLDSMLANRVATLEEEIYQSL